MKIKTNCRDCENKIYRELKETDPNKALCHDCRFENFLGEYFDFLIKNKISGFSPAKTFNVKNKIT